MEDRKCVIGYSKNRFDRSVFSEEINRIFRNFPKKLTEFSEIEISNLRIGQNIYLFLLRRLYI